jgi:cysteine-rich repeat protein
MSGTILADGGFCGADVEADGASISVTSSAHIIADAGMEPGSVTLSALQGLTIAGRVTAQSTTTNGSGGAVQGSGCTLSVPNGASIRTDGTAGLNLLQASGQMTIGGQLLSRPGHNRLEYLDSAEAPIILNTADIRPTRDCAPASGCLNPHLPVCAASSTCGNGVREAGEGCDDGNTAACDGCSPRCQVEGCGNGVIECGEQCDDGPFNGGPGEPCDATCHTVAGSTIFVPSGHRGLGCMLEWSIRAHPVSGFPPTSISCTDGDPRCDADGFIDGGCTFELTGCLNLADVRIPSCRPTTVLSMNVRRPSVTDPVDGVEAANARTLVDAVEALGLTVQSRSTVLQVGRPVTGVNRCTTAVAFRVPHAPGAFGRRLLSAGAENSDSHDVSNRVTLTCAPNAAVCGNSIVQLGEECDDGNRNDCDGCSSRCHFERCGNGVVDCGEQCDDGASNGTPGDPCSALCSETPPATRIPGGNGSRECAAEFSLAASRVLTNSRGIPSPKQICVDGDPNCDFDPTPGTCRFHVWACVGGADSRVGCAAGTVTAYDLVRPDGSEPAPFGAAHDALATALGRMTLPAGPGEECSPRIDLDVPVGRTKLLVKTDATTATGRHDRDALRLVCAPAGTQLPSR